MNFWLAWSRMYMQKNTKALLIFFSILGAMIIILLVLIFFNIKSGHIKFFFKTYTGKSEKTIQIQESQNIYLTLWENGRYSINFDFRGCGNFSFQPNEEPKIFLIRLSTRQSLIMLCQFMNGKSKNQFINTVFFLKIWHP